MYNDNIGHSMIGGKITVRGYSRHTGIAMQGGEIHLYGDYDLCGHYGGKGNMYHKSKLIVKDGKLVK